VGGHLQLKLERPTTLGALLRQRVSASLGWVNGELFCQVSYICESMGVRVL
jgi:hypothetical protein